MKQTGLFTYSDADMAAVRFQPSYAGWRSAARRLLADKIAPQNIHWVEDCEQCAPLDAEPGKRRINEAFTMQAAAACCYRSPDRWALLYRIAWRLTYEQAYLLDLAGDPDVYALGRYAKAVHRDAHKMKAFVRFREVSPDNRGPVPARFVAWFEPEHLIVEYTAEFFRKRFATMCWSILTPDKCAHYAGDGAVWFTEGATRAAAAEGDCVEEVWRTYYRSIFNPARVKLQAMRSEMPQKYWKNLPEAAEITRLVLEADQRVKTMQQERKQEDILQCGPRPQSQARQLEAQRSSLPENSMLRLRVSAAACQACHLAEHATQVVFGEGPEDAQIMLVGEQPGDEEDLAGRPFIGPAGQLLDRALDAAGLDREQLYFTNTVKHFKFKTSGKRRLHQKPDAKAVFACGDWLASEITLIDPQVIICLGLTAAQHLLSSRDSLQSLRGRAHVINGRRYIPTVHPAYVLRAQSRQAADSAFATLVADLRAAAQPPEPVNRNVGE